jgi:hypothetical protein
MMTGAAVLRVLDLLAAGHELARDMGWSRQLAGWV